MGLIRILPDQVVNQIAAGEVVERPVSVVKELLENALDAGATELRVDIEAGGRRLIRVADNGCGMMHDDALLAFERHATSKLRDVKDLLAVGTLGFRGEALPSIAAVSRVVLETRWAEERTGTRVEIAGGKMLRVEEAAIPGGTTVTVRDLFFNVPARKKFLRSEPTETAHVASLVTHYSLAHPDKTFFFRHDSRELLHVTPVETLRERVYQVFGSQTLEELVDLGCRERVLEAASAESPQSGHMRRVFRLRGFVSRPQVQKSNRNSIFLFVNRRLIRDRLLLHALSAAYHNLLPPGAFPFALLFLECDLEEVDVNVHPSKTEVRFRQGTFVHDFVRDAVREALVESRPVSSLSLRPGPQPAAQLPYSEFTQQIENQAWLGALPEAPPANPEGLPPFTLRPTAAPALRLDFGPDASPEPIPVAPPAGLKLPVPDTHRGSPADLDLSAAATLDALRDLRPLGQLHDSFIVAAGRDGLWLIDQHVAHERILFEKLLREQAAGELETQRLLLPVLVELTPGQYAEYARIASELEASGFETEPFGPRTIAVKTAPAGLAAGDVEQVIFEILEVAERELRRVSLGDLRRAMAASIACRAAIKINTRLEPAKIQWLLEELARTECPMSCPHGRPIALRYSTREILRAFQRI
ncbi:MAG: DNA mismatch repair endonuclease MutL [Bryobacterales bacterium]|nr:DNA mismatch repair endonuclease MutL [Bryobacteraceae bacterium]MDW8355819.1 DNA mismatch repair endonuclease MutL [Bryobacterales bacterium]